ncbi:hypothetical protein CNMCM5793_009327 [Aspergillus hiratsukae]|uniref:Xylanolytic transcriptional activator regulatory domain-containing protein n=1 Tax=Aspergillus hiratsukae TaxID=1194566 RepID=A0A8H6UVS6_9EURO|nr:hypothetical protein CNMCM5793_009327 [Aspergillus hiratsukae]KAF7168868.1 hypothetical protein CNMCM6106_003883 [Aspergillus hiratsukae]
MGIVQKFCELGRQHIHEQATSAIPGYRASTSVGKRRTANVGQRLPISSILGRDLPPAEVMCSLLEDYFDAVPWFSLAIYEPTFRRPLSSIAHGLAYPSHKSFLLLLAVVLGMGASYRSQRRSTDLTDNGDWQQLSADHLLKIVESHVVQLIDQPSITAAQICILFGSYHVYHGHPILSFSLLGPTIKTSQAAGLHHEPSRGNFKDIEERKRVWWTIYTWDRFASITYGKPLGSNGKVCNLNMPADSFENPYFVEPRSEHVCYSTYQRELIRLYLMASTALKAIFGSRTSGSFEELAGDAYLALVKEATQNAQRWRDELPEHLILDQEKDFLSTKKPSIRCSIAECSCHKSNPLVECRLENIPSDRVTGSSSTSHGYSFGCILGHKSIQRGNCVGGHGSVRSTLRRAQVVKRTITRILRLQDVLGKRSALSKQSTTVLKNVDTMLSAVNPRLFWLQSWQTISKKVINL